MITNIHIENFKSIQSLDMELGRLNIFIGANGSGKSNILEAIAMGSAAMEDKLDDEFLASRGIRVTESRWMKSGFKSNGWQIPIKINFQSNEKHWDIELNYSGEHYNGWTLSGGVDSIKNRLEEVGENIIKAQTRLSEFEEQNDYFQSKLKELGNKIKSNDPVSESILNEQKDLYIRYLLLKEDLEKISSSANKDIKEYRQLLPQVEESIKLSNFLIYAPENHFLRRFEEEAAIKPLGIKGEGLFKLLTIIYQEKPEQFKEIKEHLKLFDWFQDFEIPNDLKFTERRIKIKDAFLEDGLQYFDQRSANEGFLYLLFYLTLFVSDETPHFFAIDNIDNSLNPKLGSELIRILAKLANDHNKQALLTTHNPAILDGLDLEDPDQRLFVVYRNADGHTKVRRILARKPVNGIEPVRLSEAFIRGYIGGIPDNF